MVNIKVKIKMERLSNDTPTLNDINNKIKTFGTNIDTSDIKEIEQVITLLKGSMAEIVEILRNKKYGITTNFLLVIRDYFHYLFSINQLEVNPKYDMTTEAINSLNMTVFLNKFERTMDFEDFEEDGKSKGSSESQGTARAIRRR